MNHGYDYFHYHHWKDTIVSEALLGLQEVYRGGWPEKTWQRFGQDGSSFAAYPSDPPAKLTETYVNYLIDRFHIIQEQQAH